MRLWTLDFKYLDRAGLVALWRETLLAKKVLSGQTKGYKCHPQLDRFRDNPQLINNYLLSIWHEANERGYRFDKTKVGDTVPANKIKRIKTPTGQVLFEWIHLFNKLEKRDPKKNQKNMDVHMNAIGVCEIFEITDDLDRAEWERT